MFLHLRKDPVIEQLHTIYLQNSGNTIQMFSSFYHYVLERHQQGIKVSKVLSNSSNFHGLMIFYARNPPVKWQKINPD